MHSFKGEIGLVMVDKCQSTCEERKGKEGGREHFFTCNIYFSAPTVSLPLLSVLMLSSGRFSVISVAV